ncbi:MAG: hypothetical protein NTU73_14495, partial [Ignavibacteriae bacterium]|nr:hypothetical protein [Ignavibacteriota bacterium]
MATSSAGTGNWSGNFNFTTAIVIPNPPVLVAPANNSVNVSLTPLLDWQNSATATEYKVQVSTTITFNTTVLDVAGLANSGYNIQPGILVNSTLYYWRVNAKNAGGTSAWTEPWSFTTIIAAPLAPTLLLPLNNAINISVTPTFDWTDAVGASKYNIQIALNSNFTSLVYVDSAFVSTITLGPGILSGNQLYYWRVSAENIGGQSLWSTVFHFTTGTAPPAAPLLLLPTDGQTGVPITNVTFDWNTVAGANSYRIQVSTSSNFGTTFINQVVGSSQYTHYTPVFAYGTLYYWHVYATNSA